MMNQYWTELPSEERRTLAKLSQLLSELLKRDMVASSVLTDTAGIFVASFKKVKSVCARTSDCPPPASIHSTSSCQLHLQQPTEDDVFCVIMALPTQSWTLDPILTFLLKESR